jgi:hypothetical protein
MVHPRDDGARCEDYRQFQRGYAVTRMARSKTVDHVLFAMLRSARRSNAQQWYVTISRGRKSIQIFTPIRSNSAALSTQWRS